MPIFSDVEDTDALTLLDQETLTESDRDEAFSLGESHTLQTGDVVQVSDTDALNLAVEQEQRTVDGSQEDFTLGESTNIQSSTPTDTDALTLGEATQLDKGGDIRDTDAFSLAVEVERRTAEGQQEDFSLGESTQLDQGAQSPTDSDALSLAAEPAVGLADQDTASVADSEATTASLSATDALTLGEETAREAGTEPTDTDDFHLAATLEVGLADAETTTVTETEALQPSASEALALDVDVPQIEVAARDPLALRDGTESKQAADALSFGEQATIEVTLSQSESMTVTEDTPLVGVTDAEALIASAVAEDIVASLSRTDALTFADAGSVSIAGVTFLGLGGAKAELEPYGSGSFTFTPSGSGSIDFEP